MLSDFFQNILDKLRGKVNLESDTIEKVLEYISRKKINSYVYPEVIEEKLDIDIKSVMKLLILLEKQSVVKQVYKLYCPVCRDVCDEIFETLNDLEEQEMCSNCGEVLVEGEKPYKYVIVYFKVIKNG